MMWKFTHFLPAIMYIQATTRVTPATRHLAHGLLGADGSTCEEKTVGPVSCLLPARACGGESFKGWALEAAAAGPHDQGRWETMLGEGSKQATGAAAALVVGPDLGAPAGGGTALVMRNHSGEKPDPSRKPWVVSSSPPPPGGQPSGQLQQSRPSPTGRPRTSLPCPRLRANLQLVPCC